MTQGPGANTLPRCVMPSAPKAPFCGCECNFADVKAAPELRCVHRYRCKGCATMGTSLGLVPARAVRALSRATVTIAVACGGLAIASGHPAQADDPTVLTGTY